MMSPGNETEHNLSQLAEKDTDSNSDIPTKASSINLSQGSSEDPPAKRARRTNKRI